MLGLHFNATDIVKKVGFIDIFWKMGWLRLFKHNQLLAF